MRLERHYITHEIEFPNQVIVKPYENHRIRGVTSDIRVAELVERIATHNIGSPDIPFDCIIVPMINASPDYIYWVKLQTMKKDTTLAFFNEEPEEELEHLDNKVDDHEDLKE